MRRAQAERICLGLPGAVKERPFGPQTDVYKVGGKLFALMGLRGGGINLKCDPGLAQELRAAYEGVQPGYHMNKRHWNTVALDGDVPDVMLADLIEDSYDLVVASLPRATQRSLGWSPAVDRPPAGS